MDLNTFIVSDDIKKKLDIQAKKKETVQDKILKIFTDAAKIGKKELSVNEVTAAYYNLYTSTGKEKVKNKKVITMFLYLLKGGKDDNGKIESVGRGKFRLRKK